MPVEVVGDNRVLRFVEQGGLFADFGVGMPALFFHAAFLHIPLDGFGDEAPDEPRGNLHGGDDGPRKPDAIDVKLYAGHDDGGGHAAHGDQQAGHGPEEGEAETKQHRGGEQHAQFAGRGQAREPVFADEVQHRGGVDLDGGHEDELVAPGGEGTAEFVAAFARVTGDGPGTNDDNLVLKELRFGAIGFQRLAVADMRDGLRPAVIANPALVEPVVGTFGHREFEQGRRRPGHRDGVIARLAVEMLAHDEVVLGPQLRGAPACGGVPEQRQR